MTINDEQDHARSDTIVRLTLEDGTRIQLQAEEIIHTEPAGRATLVHLASGEQLKVVQDPRTVDLRITVALSPPPPRQEPPSQDDTLPVNTGRHASSAASVAHRPEPLPLGRRAKRLLLGRSSLPVLMIARASKGREEK